MNDQNPSNEEPDNQNPDESQDANLGEDLAGAAEGSTHEVDPSRPAEPDDQKPTRTLLPSTAAGRTRLAAAGIATAFLLAGGLGGYAIGQANDGPDHREMGWHGGFDGRGPGPGGR